MISVFVLVAVVAFTLAVICLIAIAVMFFGLHIRDVRAFLTGKTSARAVAEYRSSRKVRKRATVLEGEQQEWEGTVSHISRGAKRGVIRKREIADIDVVPSEASTGDLDDGVSEHQPSEASTGSLDNVSNEGISSEASTDSLVEASTEDLTEASTDDLTEASTDSLTEASTDDLVGSIGSEDATIGLFDEAAERGTTILKEDDQ